MMSNIAGSAQSPARLYASREIIEECGRTFGRTRVGRTLAGLGSAQIRKLAKQFNNLAGPARSGHWPDPLPTPKEWESGLVRVEAWR